ncbi:HNH endonuclease [Variovorax boronicumulans]|uniref:HNH endonuclease n=1 Tax=Variovorax boronicumulans TaxID=436515 RepID=UPI0012FE40EB|nr:HNH endonuclease [Variovorax boronicumulans]
MDVFDACVASTGANEIRQRLMVARPFVQLGYEEYLGRAAAFGLYSIAPTEIQNDELLIPEVTPRELKNLYTQQLSTRGRPARLYYDKILASAPRGKCPLCGFGQASTLDHFLAKSSFPIFSVFPANLVPACKDCNHGKGGGVASVEAEQVLHPYFESAVIGQQQWLFASVEMTSPVTAIFYSQPPADWDAALRSRATRHFEEFDLARRFSVEAATEVAGLVPVLNLLFEKAGEDGVKHHMDLMANSSRQVEPNSWKTALLQALAESEWYCKGGFKPGNN